jgi:hypothetical protein
MLKIAMATFLAAILGVTLSPRRSPFPNCPARQHLTELRRFPSSRWIDQAGHCQPDRQHRNGYRLWRQPQHPGQCHPEQCNRPSADHRRDRTAAHCQWWYGRVYGLDCPLQPRPWHRGNTEHRASGAGIIPTLDSAPTWTGNHTFTGTINGARIAPSCANILAYGGDNTGSVDNSAAWTAALAGNNGQQTCIYFPRGTYLFSSAATASTASGATGASITIKGDGQEVSTLKFANGVSGLGIT